MLEGEKEHFATQNLLLVFVRNSSVKSAETPPGGT